VNYFVCIDEIFPLNYLYVNLNVIRLLLCFELDFRNLSGIVQNVTVIIMIYCISRLFAIIRHSLCQNMIKCFIFFQSEKL
jgi:hypothetical protein